MPSLSNLVIPPYVKIGLRLLPYLVAIGLAVGLIATRNTLHEVRSQDKLAAVRSELATKTQELEWTQKLSTAQSSYSESLKSLLNKKATSYADTEAYSKTPAGQQPCLTSDRLSGIAAYQAAVKSSGTAGGSE